jgi:hypothetical protein
MSDPNQKVGATPTTDDTGDGWSTVVNKRKKGPPAETKPASPPARRVFVQKPPAAKPPAPAPKKVVHPPPPKAVPKPVPKPPPVVVGAVVPCTDPLNRGWPLGFESEEQFQVCMNELYKACEESGITVKYVGVRGSAATYKSRNPHKKGQTFDSKGKGRSDIDAFFVTTDFFDDIRPNKDGFFHPDKMNREFPALKEWGKKWTKTLRRDITPGAFRPSAAAMNQDRISY